MNQSTTHQDRAVITNAILATLIENKSETIYKEMESANKESLNILGADAILTVTYPNIIADGAGVKCEYIASAYIIDEDNIGELTDEIIKEVISVMNRNQLLHGVTPEVSAKGFFHAFEFTGRFNKDGVQDDEGAQITLATAETFNRFMISLRADASDIFQRAMAYTFNEE